MLLVETTLFEVLVRFLKKGGVLSIVNVLFKVELYDYANPKNLQYSLPIVVKEVQTDKGLQLFKFNDLLYGPRSDVMIQWVFGDGRLF